MRDNALQPPVIGWSESDPKDAKIPPVSDSPTLINHLNPVR